VRANEITHNLTIVHVYEREQDIPAKLESHTAIVDQIYPKITINVTFVKGSFTPGYIDEIAKELQIPKNFMFLTCPSDHFPHNLADFGGVRLITH